VEVKSFLGRSIIYELHEAVGQYSNYRRLLKMKGEDRILFLALSKDAFDILFTDEFGEQTIEDEKIKFIIFDTSEKEKAKWIK
jgi:hypothetical protein